MVRLPLSIVVLVLNSVILVPTGVWGSSLDGTALSSAWAIPFIGLLLSLSLMPIIAPRFWHTHFGKISALWALITILMIWIGFGLQTAVEDICATYIDHFIPFIVFILSLFVIAGGLRIEIITKATPFFNTLFLALAGSAASWIGTTGAAMLFIHSFLAVNKHRKTKRHLVIFFIFIVCNIGGALSAIGDPPLFLGFLNGIDFFWPTKNLFLPFLTVMSPLLIIFYLLDRYHYRQEGQLSHALDTERFIVKISGKENIVFMFLAIASIIFSGMWHPERDLHIGILHINYPDLLRSTILLLLTVASLKMGNPSIRAANHFNWDPFKEVLKVFAAIFITASPVLAILKAGTEGPFSMIVSLVNSESGPNNEVYFWVTGILSAFLDNAPTYLVFFNLAGADPSMLMTTLAKTLIAISIGSVFMGAMTYIGNAPNFMVKAIAEQNKISMPSFFGYMGWSITILLPLFYLSAVLWIK